MKKSSLIVSITFLSLTSTLCQPESCCGEVFRKLGFPSTGGVDTCEFISTVLQSSLESARINDPELNTTGIFVHGPSPRDLQSRKSNTPNIASSVNQGDAVPTLYPFALAGGSVGGTGSEAGTNALTTIGLNPAIFFADMDDPAESARLGRLMDLSVIVPLNEVQSGTLDKLTYFGLRARVNTAGSIRGGKLERQVLDAFQNYLQNAADEKTLIKTLILEAPDCSKCAAQIIKFSEGTIQAEEVSLACGGNFIVEDGDAISKVLEAETERLLEEADKKYFGLDLRGDFGDPTLGAVDSARGTSLYAGIGWGKSLSKREDASKNIRMSVGFRYKDMEDIRANVFDLDGAFGFDVTWPYQFQEVKFGLGLEFRTSLEEKVDEFVNIDLAEAFETDYLYFRTSLNIPITQSNSFSVQYGTSIVGEKSSVLSINFNWKLLLEDD